MRLPQDVISNALRYQREDHLQRFRHMVQEHRGDVDAENAIYHANLAIEYEAASNWWDRNRAKLAGL